MVGRVICAVAMTVALVGCGGTPSSPPGTGSQPAGATVVPGAPSTASKALLQAKLRDLQRVADLQGKSPDPSKLQPAERTEEEQIIGTWQQKYGEPWDNSDLPGAIAKVRQQLAASGTPAP